MSVRCHIAFYPGQPDDPWGVKPDEWDALIYRHCDGWPGELKDGSVGVLPEIYPFLCKWKARRGLNDVEYCAARLLQYLTNKYDEFMKKLYQEHPHWKGDSYTGLLGHGICRVIHPDIEYFYIVRPDIIECYKVDGCYPKPDQKPIITVDVP